MKKRIQHLIYMPLLVGAIACFTACNHKELCYNHDEHSSSKLLIKANYELEWCYLHDHEHAIDWANNWPDHFTDYHSLCPHVPAGLRMVVYKDGESHDMHNLPATGGENSITSETFSSNMSSTFTIVRTFPLPTMGVRKVITWFSMICRTLPVYSCWAAKTSSPPDINPAFPSER